MTSPPTSYDPNSLGELTIPQPSAPLVVLGSNVVLQPPLTYRGVGPGIIVFLPSEDDISKDTTQMRKSLDPQPIFKWAEEGYAVVGITAFKGLSIEDALTQGLDILQAHEKVDVKDKFAVIVYAADLVCLVSKAVAKESRVASLIAYGSYTSPLCITPTILHLPGDVPPPDALPSDGTIVHKYENSSHPAFVFPQSTEYNPGNAAIAHSRTLVFLRKCLGGPFFDIEAVWDRHLRYEMVEKSVAKTLGTMVAEPYVHCVPTLCGGVGREGVVSFYRDHMIFNNSADITVQPIHRTVSPDRLIDEFIMSFTHDCAVDYILPGVPPTGKKLAFPMLGMVTFRGDRIYNEEVWWDQANVLRQAGLLPSHISHTDAQTGDVRDLRLPVAGREASEMLVDVSKGRSNHMLDPAWNNAPVQH